MIVLDEHFPESQRQLLRSWRVSVRQIGRDVGRAGMDDDEIIPFLIHLRRPTLFTLDFGFYKRSLCHPRYCLICLEVGQYESASFVRRVLARRLRYRGEANGIRCSRVPHGSHGLANTCAIGNSSVVGLGQICGANNASPTLRVGTSMKAARRCSLSIRLLVWGL
jgi:hypothetical protein